MKLSEEQKDVIRLVGSGIIVASAMVCPNIAQLLKFLEPDNSKKRHVYKQSISRLRKRGILQLSGDNINLTKRGRLILKCVELENIDINATGYWDGKWHLVCYDIPEKYKSERDYFRLKLIGLGFAQIQDSLWAYPHHCKEEIAIIADYFGVGNYVAYLDTDYLPYQTALIRKFNLRTRSRSLTRHN